MGDRKSSIYVALLSPHKVFSPKGSSIKGYFSNIPLTFSLKEFYVEIYAKSGALKNLNEVAGQYQYVH